MCQLLMYGLSLDLWCHKCPSLPLMPNQGGTQPWAEWVFLFARSFIKIKEKKSGLKVSLDRETPRWEGSCLLFAWLLYGLLKPVWLMFPKPLKFGRQLTRGYSFAGPSLSELLPGCEQSVYILQTSPRWPTMEEAKTLISGKLWSWAAIPDEGFLGL